MELSAAVLYLYLLFPLMFPMQEELAIALGRESPRTTASEQTLAALHVFLGREQEDGEAPFLLDDLWLDEGIPLPDGLENPKFGPQSEGSSLATGEAVGGVSVAEKQFLNAQERLRLFSYGEEEFEVLKTFSGREMLVSVNADTVVRTVYDERYRVKERLEFSDGASELTKRVSYRYDEESSHHAPISMTEEFISEKKERETVFTHDGKPLFVYDYVLVSKEPESQQKTDAADSSGAVDDSPETVSDETPEKSVELVKVLSKKTARVYDDSGRLVSEEESSYTEREDRIHPGRKKMIVTVRKNVFIYTNGLHSPDFEFYENGVLRMRTKYSGDDQYTESMYFDGGFSVEVQYRHGRKVLERILLNGTETEVRNFD